MFPSLLVVLAGGRLKLASEGSIAFGDHATLRATCGADNPSVKGVIPSQTDGWPTGNATLELLVAPSCVGLGRSVPCAAHASLTTPPLFWCRLVGSGGSQAIGPFNAQRKSIEENGIFLGLAVLLVCPWPDVAALRTLAGYTPADAGKDAEITIEVLHGPTAGSASTLPFNGFKD